MLQSEYNALLAEAGELKNMLMVHAGCDDPRIGAWIRAEAAKFVDKTSAPIERKGSDSSASPFHGRNGQCIMASGSITADENADSITQASTVATGLLSPPMPTMKTGDINYDHMPDEMFADETL